MKRGFLVFILIFTLFSSVTAFADGPLGDLNGDYVVNMGDLAVLVSQWLVDERVVVPDVSNMRVVNAQAAIADANLVVGEVRYEYNDTVGVGRIISQEPLAFGKAAPKSEVVIVASVGPLVNDFEMTWVYVDDSGEGMRDNQGEIISREGFSGLISIFETTNDQYCEFLNSALDSGDVVVYADGRVYGAAGMNEGDDFVGQFYFDTYESNAEMQIMYDGVAFHVRGRDGCYMGNHPVVGVSWYGAMAFCNYYGWELPNEWQWQAVADFDGSYVYGCGLTIDQSKANYYDGCCANPSDLTCYPFTNAVNYYEPFGYGVFDMAGNVWEWTSTASGAYRVVKGGGWYYSGDICRVYNKNYHQPGYCNTVIGFRVCQSVE